MPYIDIAYIVMRSVTTDASHYLDYPHQIIYEDSPQSEWLQAIIWI